jgi:hypothetical protein
MTTLRRGPQGLSPRAPQPKNAAAQNFVTPPRTPPRACRSAVAREELQVSLPFGRPTVAWAIR